MNLDVDGRGSPARVTVDLEVAQPFDAPSVFEFLDARAIPGIEHSSSIQEGLGALARTTLTYARTLNSPGGPAAFEVTCTRVAANDPAAAAGGLNQHASPWNVSAEIEATDPRDVPDIAALIARLFDLEADAARIDADLSRDAALAPLVQAHPGSRVPRAVDPAELVVRAIVGQQITVAAARGHLARLVAHAGSPVTIDLGTRSGLTSLFPTPAQIMRAVPYVGALDELDPERPLRLPRRQSNAVRAAAEALTTGELDARLGADPATLASQLASLPAVGPWTAAYIALRVLGDPDAWLIGDVALLAGARAIRILPSTRAGSKQAEHRALAARAVQWAPWRSYASMHLWRAAAPATSPKETSHAVR